MYFRVLNRHTWGIFCPWGKAVLKQASFHHCAYSRNFPTRYNYKSDVRVLQNLPYNNYKVIYQFLKKKIYLSCFRFDTIYINYNFTFTISLLLNNTNFNIFQKITKNCLYLFIYFFPLNKLRM